MAAGRSVLLAGIVSFVTLIVAYPMAFVIAKTQNPGRNTFLLILVLASMQLDMVIRLYGMMVILGDNGLINQLLQGMDLTDGPVALMYNFLGVVFGLVQFSMPFMILTLVGVIKGIPPSLEEAARSLGASRRRAFLRVTLPASMPGILSGSLLVFALSISSYIVPALMGGFRVGVLPIHIYQQVAESARFQFGATIAVILFLISATAVVIYQKLGNRQFRGARLMERKIPLPMLILAILGFCYLLFPILVVVLAGLTTGEFLTFPPKGLSLRWVISFLNSEKYLSAFFFSFRLALMTMVVSTILGTAAGAVSCAFSLCGTLSIAGVLSVTCGPARCCGRIRPLRILHCQRDGHFANHLGIVDRSHPVLNALRYWHGRRIFGDIRCFIGRGRAQPWRISAAGLSQDHIPQHCPRCSGGFNFCLHRQLWSVRGVAVPVSAQFRAAANRDVQFAALQI